MVQQIIGKKGDHVMLASIDVRTRQVNSLWEANELSMIKLKAVTSDGKGLFPAALIALHLMAEKFRLGPKHPNERGRQGRDRRTDRQTGGRTDVGPKKWGAAGMHNAAGDG